MEATALPGLGLALLLCVLVLSWPRVAGAGSGVIYTFTDDRGVVHFTNVPRGDARFQVVRARDTLQRIRRAPDRREYDLLIHATALETRVPPRITVAGDATKLAWAVSNLVANALRYTPGGGCVTIVGNADGGVVRVVVSDTGAGIPAERCERIFDRPGPGGGTTELGGEGRRAGDERRGDGNGATRELLLALRA